MEQQELSTLSKKLSCVLRRDQHGFKRRLKGLRKRLETHKPISRDLEKLKREMENSLAARERRAELLPRPEFPEALPVSARREEIAETIRRHQVVIVAGETGSGKTTQLPKICLLAGRGVGGLIGCTQPRRVAARSIAARVASELKTEVGRAVGYKVRFSDRLSEETYIKLMTDGILLAETQGDRFLEHYDTLIIDEAHERSLNIDFLLGYLKQLLPRRRDLKLIVTSATIDTERFAAHFDNAPIIQIEGRAYPVETRYRPLEEEQDPTQGILAAMDEIAGEQAGDTLIFLPGEREIRETTEALRKHHPPGTEILPLYARLSAAEQNRVFQPGQQPRVVLATNVAETSLTVPRIRAVIDPGLARISRYSTRSKVQRLPVEPISRASADQRKGRCGRVGPGLCLRLYSEEDYLSRPEFTPPELLRSSLAAVILRMLDLKLGDIEAFPFLEAPDSRQISDGFKLLEELGAVDRRRCLTEIGRQLAPLPIDPRIARMILAARDYVCLREALIIAAALSIQDPRERPLESQQAADQAQAKFRDDKSDFLSYIKLWDAFKEQERHLSRNKLRQWCRQHFLSYTRMLEWVDIHQQLHGLAREMGWRPNQEAADYPAIHRALLSGLLGNIATRTLPGAGQDGGYQGARGIKLYIFPGSGQFKLRPKWIMAAELVETSRLYARDVARIEPEWIEEAAGELLCRYSYSEAHWEKRRQQVVAYEQVTVYGLTVIPRRKVHYGPVDPVVARQIFIRSALVEGEYDSDAEFFKHNRQLIGEIEDLEHKARRPDILVDEQTLYEFYDARLPEGLHNGPAFEQWRLAAERQQPRLLFLTREDLMRRDGGDITRQAFPDFVKVGGARLKLDYHFEPGHEADGVTLSLPVQLLNQLNPPRFEWLVPGLLKEKIIALMRTLPKQIRRQFVPLPDFAQAALEALEPSELPLTEALGHYLHRISGVELPADAWQPDKLPPHLRMNFLILDERGQRLAAGRDLPALQQAWRDQAARHFADLPKHGLEREHLRSWDFDTLPETVDIKLGGLNLPGYPALVDKGGDAALEVFSDPDQARAAHREGLRRLFLIEAQTNLRQLCRQMPVSRQLTLIYAGLGQVEDLRRDIVDILVDELFLAEPWPRDRRAYQQRLETGSRQLFAAAAERLNLLETLLADWKKLRENHAELLKPLTTSEKDKNPRLGSLQDLRQLKGELDNPYREALEEIRRHLDGLIYPGFAREVPLSRLQHFPRYLKAVDIRLQRLRQSPAKDARKAAELAPLWQAYQQRAKKARGRDPELEAFRWLLEELRVSLFAQELKTAQPVSLQRAEAAWRALAAGAE